MPSLISKITLRVTRRFVPSKKMLSTADLDVVKFRAMDVKKPKRWMVAGCELKPGTLGELPCCAVVPKHVKHPDRVVLYLHGGAYVAGPLFWQWSMCGLIAKRSGVRIEVLDYPLTPESTYEETVGKTLVAYQELAERYAPGNISVLSDSAGGGLSAALMIELARLNIERPRRQLMISPWIDVELTDPEVEKIDPRDPILSAIGLRACGVLYAGRIDKTNDPLVSPIKGDLSVLPETHIFNGTEDLLSPSIRQFSEKATAQGVDVHYSEWPGQMHAWVVVPVIPEAMRARKKIAAEISR